MFQAFEINKRRHRNMKLVSRVTTKKKNKDESRKGKIKKEAYHSSFRKTSIFR
jgi:hypothetical protein